MNAINDNNNRKEDIKKDDVEIDDVNHSCIGDEYKDLIKNILKYRLKDRALSFTEFDNRKLDLTNIVNNYLEKKDIDVDDRLFTFEKSIKRLSVIGNRINGVTDNFKPKTETKYEDKKRIISILNAVKKFYS